MCGRAVCGTLSLRVRCLLHLYQGKVMMLSNSKRYTKRSKENVNSADMQELDGTSYCSRKQWATVQSPFLTLLLASISFYVLQRHPTEYAHCMASTHHCLAQDAAPACCATTAIECEMEACDAHGSQHVNSSNSAALSSEPCHTCK